MAHITANDLKTRGIAAIEASLAGGRTEAVVSVRGAERYVVMELAQEAGISVSEPNLTRYDVFNADECFLTGTGAELIPVTKVDGRVIGTGKPGPVTKALVKSYHALTQVSGEPI